MMAESGPPVILAEDARRWHAKIAGELRAAFEDVLEVGKFTMGRHLSAFEGEFAAYSGARACVGTSSGTSALQLALLALGVGPGDEVITVPNTYVATAFAVTYVGAVPVFVDVDPITYNLDPQRIAEVRTDRTRAAHGATLGERRAGSLGDLAAFSFYPTKVLGALGDGGAITTSREDLEQRARQLRYMGQRAIKHDHEALGYQERLDEMQAAFLQVKLRQLEDQIAGRRRVAAAYRELLAGTPLTLPAHDVSGRHVYYMFTVLAPSRDALARHLLDRGITTQVIYPRLVPEQKAYRDLPWRAGELPVAKNLPSRILCLPMFAELSTAEIERVAEAIREFYGPS
jgi:dTDP-4-amino-4,6-dideoxygalactose transaminase